MVEEKQFVCLGGRWKLEMRVFSYLFIEQTLGSLRTSDLREDNLHVAHFEGTWTSGEMYKRTLLSFINLFLNSFFFSECLVIFGVNFAYLLLNNFSSGRVDHCKMIYICHSFYTVSSASLSLHMTFFLLSVQSIFGRIQVLPRNGCSRFGLFREANL